MGSPVYTTVCMVDIQFPGHGCMGDLTTKRNFDLQATWVIGVLGLCFRHVIHGYLYNQALADVWSTGAGIKCLHCTLFANTDEKAWHI